MVSVAHAGETISADELSGKGTVGPPPETDTRVTGSHGEFVPIAVSCIAASHHPERDDDISGHLSCWGRACGRLSW